MVLPMIASNKLADKPSKRGMLKGGWELK